MIQKSDTINSTTIFINPNDVHSPQQQQEEMPGGSGRQGQTSEQGVKRRYSECGEGDSSAGAVKVVVVRPGQQAKMEMGDSRDSWTSSSIMVPVASAAAQPSP